MSPGGGAPAEDARGELNAQREADRITVKTGDALEMFEATGGDFDFIFNDINKHEYPRVLDKALPRVRKGGLLVAHNVLWSGRVAQLTSTDDKDTPAIRDFNTLAASSPGCVYSILPLDDGVGVLFKDEIPDPRDSLLIGLCRAAGLFPLLLSGQELDRVQARIDQVADLEELNRSLADAIREIYAQIARFAPMV